MAKTTKQRRTYELTEGRRRSLANLTMWKKGESGNKNGRKPNCISLMEFGRKFLLQTPDGDQQSRLRTQWEALHQIARDPTNKLCVAANTAMMSYSFGPPVPEISLKVAALQVLQNMGLAQHEYIEMQLMQGDESYVIPESELLVPAADMENDE